MSYDYPKVRDASELTFIGNQTPIIFAIEEVDVSSGDHSSTMTECRYITALGDGDIKVDLQGTDGNSYTNTFPCRDGICRVSNVTKVYQTGTTATDMILVK